MTQTQNALIEIVWTHNVPEYCGGTELGEIDFGSYAAGVLDELEGK